ncbi:hypothetical protein ACN3XK_26755, partial [Actinomadura welshii]
MRTVDPEHYAALLRLAYLVLDDGDAPLGRARRAAARAARARDSGYPAMRTRLVAILLTDPPAGRHRLHRLFVEPARPARGPVRAALLELPPRDRLAYLLRRDGLTAPEAAAELGEHVEAAFWDVDRATAAVGDRTGLDEAAQLAEIEGFEPDVVRLRPPRAVRPAWRAAAAVVLAAALPAVAAFALTRPDGTSGVPEAVDPGAWRTVTRPTIEEWPAQGGLRHETGLLRRAADAWRAERGDPPRGRVFLLYAGTVDGASLVVLRDSPGPRDTPSVAQYFERDLSRGVESVRKLGTGAGQLITLGMTWRYLVPPWLQDVRAAVPGGREPDWVPVGVADGLSDRLPWRWFRPGCQNYVAFRMVFRPAGGGAHKYTQLASHDPLAAAPRVWFRDPPEEAGRFRWAALSAVACEGATTLSEAADLRLSQVWAGKLPDRGGRARLLAVEASSPRGTRGTAVLVSDDGRALSERGGTNAEAISSPDAMAAAVWWRSARRWHLVAAAGSEVERLKTVGELGSRESDGGGAPLLTVPGPRTGGPSPETSGLPVVHVVAYEEDGDRTVVSPS